MSFLKGHVIFPSIFPSIFGAIENNSSTFFFNPKIIYFVQKQPTKGQIFDNFESPKCSSENELNSLCHF